MQAVPAARRGDNIAQPAMAQQIGSPRQIACGNAGAYPRRGTAPVLVDYLGHGVGIKPQLSPDPSQKRRIPRPPSAKTEILADDNVADAQIADKAITDEGIGALAGKACIKMRAVNVVKAVIPQYGQFGPLRGQPGSVPK